MAAPVKRPRGTTVMELLIASALLLTLTGVLFAALLPVMGRSGTLDDKQDDLQRVIVLREYLARRLQGSYVKKVRDLSIEFYQPDVVTTRVGEVQRVTEEETPAWDETRTFEIAFENGEVVDQVRGTRDKRRVLWDLGPGSRVRFDGTSLPLVVVEVETPRGQVTGTSKRRLPIVLDRYFRE